MVISPFATTHHPPSPSLPPACRPPPPRRRAKVFELQPDIAWDKGKAVLWLLDKLVVPMALAPTGVAVNGAAGVHGADTGTGTGGGGGGEEEEEEEEEGQDDEFSDRFFTVFIGDDKTDEVRVAWCKVKADTTVTVIICFFSLVQG